MIWLTAALTGLSLFLFLSLIISLWTADSHRRLAFRLAAYGDDIRPPAERARSERRLLNWLRAGARIFRKFRIAAYWGSKLKQAAIPLKGTEFVAASTVCGLAAALLAVVVWPAGGVVASLTGAILGLAGPMVVVNRLVARRLDKISVQLGDALVLMAGALQSGYSFTQALELAGREMSAPISEEFSQLLREIKLGVPLEAALGGMSQRLKNSDLDLVITAVLIQRQIGGNLAEVLNNIAESIRERVRMRGEIKTLTAQGRMSGWIISLLPLVMLGVMCLLNYGYVSILFTSAWGRILLVIGAASQIVGIMLIKKIVNIGG
ncbi:MAG: type II secretion system F family protein [Negativicutes bacterium]|nr:type II secretion system F family protein [Negativicutes bacterium]